jgi:mono/diheme cytochrome c family protein
MRCMKTLFLALAPLSLASFALAQDLPAGPGKDKTEMICGACHGLEGVMNMNTPKSAWQDIVEDMRGRGADGKEEDFKAIVDYLAKFYGAIVQVNKANAKDIQDQLYLTSDEAAAIVKYRDANGGIKDWASLAKVPGLDIAKIEPLKKRVKF